MVIAAGGFADAADLAGLAHDGTQDTAIGTAASGFTATAQTARVALNGALVFISITLTSTNAITATAGNIADTTVFTLDPEYRPNDQVAFVWTGVQVGGGNIDTAGTVQIRTASDSLAAGASIRLTATYLRVP